jgi:23S rRNA (cytidine1920-2'-O)/16S rRNA (cytidine1409-2'-O)-methyltransferase
VIPAWFCSRSCPGAEGVVLVKPQFEASRGEVGKGGIVRDVAVRERAVERVLAAARGLGLLSCRTIPSPLPGADGNVEFLAFLRAEPG